MNIGLICSRLKLCCWKATELLLCIYSVSTGQAADKLVEKQVLQPLSFQHIATWAIGVLLVLCVFFACVWLMKKLGALPVNVQQNMKVLAGLSLGMKDKILLVQVGKKQLVLGVSPGKIKTLLVLEGEDRVFQEPLNKEGVGDFTQMLKQLMPETKK